MEQKKQTAPPLAEVVQQVLQNYTNLATTMSHDYFRGLCSRIAGEIGTDTDANRIFILLVTHTCLSHTLTPERIAGIARMIAARMPQRAAARSTGTS